MGYKHKVIPISETGGRCYMEENPIYSLYYSSLNQHIRYPNAIVRKRRCASPHGGDSGLLTSPFLYCHLTNSSSHLIIIPSSFRPFTSIHFGRCGLFLSLVLLNSFYISLNLTLSPKPVNEQCGDLRHRGSVPYGVLPRPSPLP